MRGYRRRFGSSMNRLQRIFLINAIALLLTACGTGEDDTPQTPGTSGDNSTKGLNSLVIVIPEPAGTNCAGGGEKINSGLDSNSDGVLEPTEVSSSSFVCNGIAQSAGTNGLNSLVNIATEPAGSNCSTGGEKVTSGLDTNSDGLLEPPEVTLTGYVCNGSNGISGTNGTNGLNSLVNIVSEPVGAACTDGGEKVTSGLDTNGDGVLQPAEVLSSTYACNGVNGTNGSAGTNGLNSLVDTGQEPAGATCVNGGEKVTSGQDANADGVLQSSEVTATSYIC